MAVRTGQELPIAPTWTCTRDGNEFGSQAEAMCSGVWDAVCLLVLHCALQVCLLPPRSRPET